MMTIYELLFSISSLRSNLVTPETFLHCKGNDFGAISFSTSHKAHKSTMVSRPELVTKIVLHKGRLPVLCKTRFSSIMIFVWVIIFYISNIKYLINVTLFVSDSHFRFFTSTRSQSSILPHPVWQSDLETLKKSQAGAVNSGGGLESSLSLA